MATQGRYGGSEFTKTYSLKYLDPYIASQDTWRDVKVSQGQGGGRGGADLHSSTQRISDQLLLLYRKIPIISPGLIQLREGCLGGLINGEACIRGVGGGGGETKKRVSKKAT